MDRFFCRFFLEKQPRQRTLYCLAFPCSYVGIRHLHDKLRGTTIDASC